MYLYVHIDRDIWTYTVPTCHHIVPICSNGQDYLNKRCTEMSPQCIYLFTQTLISESTLYRDVTTLYLHVSVHTDSDILNDTVPRCHHIVPICSQRQGDLKPTLYWDVTTLYISVHTDREIWTNTVLRCHYIVPICTLRQEDLKNCTLLWCCHIVPFCSHRQEYLK